MPNALRENLKIFNQYTEIIVAFAVVLIIGIILVPVPPGVLDFLFVINISLGVIIILLTLFTSNVLEFSTFPTLLLVTTMYRLALNITSTRLILSDGQAGRVIDAFANFVTGDNYVVGAVIFLIIVIVQMLVVTSGASRVSEVAARFTLDAMPGKQMAIDADLNAGLVDEATAKKRRIDLQREADFHGAMDGASKFVKGDAIAGIIITLVNLLGGIVIFSVQQDMPVMVALERFGKLTIGDGLVSQIPSLLISVASGILVTRSDDGKSFGTSLGAELFNFSKVSFLAAIVILLIGLVPAFPLLPFFMMSIFLATAGYLLLEGERAKASKEIEDMEVRDMPLEAEKPREDTIMDFQVEPISLEIGYGLISLTDEGNENNLVGHIMGIRRQCASEMGIILNPIRIRDNLQLNPNEYVIKIKGNTVTSGEIYSNKYMLIDPGEQDFQFNGIKTKDPAFGLDALWIDEADKDEAELMGYTIVDGSTVLITHLKETIKTYSYELMGRQEVKKLLEGIKEKYPVVVDELIPDILSLGEVQKVLQNLLRESVPINDLVTILETLADYGNMTKDSELLTEYVRQSLKRTISKKYLDGEGKLMVVTIHPDLEEIIASNIQKSNSGSIPVLAPDIITKIFDNINEIQNQLTFNGIEAVILASPKIRVAFKNLITFNFPNIGVLSLNEVPNDIEIQAIGMVDKL